MTIKQYIKKRRMEGYGNEEIEEQFKIMREYPEVFEDEPEIKEVVLKLQEV